MGDEWKKQKDIGRRLFYEDPEKFLEYYEKNFHEFGRILLSAYIESDPKIHYFLKGYIFGLQANF